MTVSRVVNNEASVLAATRERVEQAIQELGYVPNLAARNLASGWQVRIALLYDNPSSAYLSELLVGCLDEANKLDIQLVIENCAKEAEAETIVAQLAAGRIDAVILPPPLCDDSLLIEALANATIPAVQLATGQPSPNCHAIMIDDHAAALAMTKYLVDAGHKRIGFIVGPVNQTASGLRKAGHLQALADAGIAPCEELIVQGDFTYRSGLAATETLLALDNPPTAIFASNDDMAAAAIAVAHKHGIDVPTALSVCGYDDTAMAVTIWPEITTIRQPVSEMAAAAARILAEEMNKKGRPTAARFKHQHLPFDRVDRASVARIDLR